MSLGDLRRPATKAPAALETPTHIAPAQTVDENNSNNYQSYDTLIIGDGLVTCNR